MSRNGTGIYNLPAGNPVVTGTVISSTWANSTLTDIASALTGSVAADGQTPMVGDLDMNTNKIVNLEPGTIAGNAVEYDQFVAATTTNVNITGGSIDGTPIGNTTRSSGKFTTLQANGATTLTSTLGVTGYATFGDNGEFNGTGALKLPTGTTAQQPTPATGMLRFNTTSTKFEGYNGSAWGSIANPAGSNTQIQYNDNGVFGASSALTFNGTTLATTTLSSTNLSDGTNSTSTTNCIQGSAKAWVNFNGASGSTAIRSSYNVSSVTRTALGLYTVAFTNSFTDANYAMVGSAQRNDGQPYVAVVSPSPSSTQTASTAYLVTGYSGSQASPGYYSDCSICSVAFFR